jgi:hypothetical protein
MEHSQHWLPPLIAAADQLDQYGNNFLQKQIIGHIENGRVFGEIHPHRSDYGGTRSLRFSYSHPPLQQMPKHDETLAPLIRGVFLPEEGDIWASLDYSQQEFRLVVHFAAQKNLPGAAAARDRYSNEPNFDIHAHASELTGGIVTRQDGKTFNFMTIYGAGPETTAKQIKKPLAETKTLLDLYSAKMPFITRLSDAYKNTAQHKGYFTLFSGACRHFNLWFPGGRWEKGAGPCDRTEAERRTHDPSHPWYGRQLWRAEGYKALNYLIQSAAAIQTKEWMRACFREGVVPLLQMHDALELSVASPDTAEMVARLGEEVIKLDVPMRVDVSYGRNWGDAKHTWAECAHAHRASRDDSCLDRVNGAAVLPPLAPSVDAPAEPEPPADELLPWQQLPAHICARCKLDPPDGTERLSAYNDQWLHPGCEDELLSLRLAEEGISDPAPASEPPPPPQSPPPASSGNSHGGNGQVKQDDSKTAAERRTHADEHAGEPFDDLYLRKQGYRLTNAFDYTLADRTLLYQQNRYELPVGFKPSKKRPRKQFLPSHHANGIKVFGPTARRVIYNWPAIMHAAPGSFILVAEGEKNADILIKAGLLATTVLSHKWTPECIAALTGHHVIVLADHDDTGKEGAAIAARAQKDLAPIAASTRIVPAMHLWKHLPSGTPAPKPNDDVEDWIRHGGDVRRLLDICLEVPAAGIISAKPFRFRAEADIPRWDWLYGNLLLRGEVARTAATGGTGKSSLSIVEALAMTSGRTLLNETVTKPLRVILINLEDTPDTMEKRIAAVMRHYGLTPADIGDRLIVLAKGEVKIKVARQLRSGDVERDEAIIKALTRLMIEHAADVLSIDSFIRTHKVHENDNSAIQEVVECFEDIAQGANGAVHLWHHNRKPGGEKATIESARGASAFIDACRTARVLDGMQAKEHEQLLGIAPDMLPAVFYFRAFSGKRSFAPPADQSDWFKRESLILANGDNVGIATLWTYPATQDAIAPEIATAVIREIGDGMPNRQRFTNHNAATNRAAWPIVQKHCPDKTEDQCRRIIAAWIKQGLLYVDEYHDPTRRTQQSGLFAREGE